MTLTSPIQRPASRMETTDSICTSWTSWKPPEPRLAMGSSQFVNERCSEVDRNASSGRPSNVLPLITFRPLRSMGTPPDRKPKRG